MEVDTHEKGICNRTGYASVGRDGYTGVRGRQGAGRKPAVRYSTFAVVGEVTAIAGENITLTILAGNRTVKDLIGEDITVVTTDETVFRHFGDDLGVYITLEDVAVGQARFCRRIDRR